MSQSISVGVHLVQYLDDHVPFAINCNAVASMDIISLLCRITRYKLRDDFHKAQPLSLWHTLACTGSL